MTATPTLLGAPFDAASSFLRGAAAAPPLIRAALKSGASNWWTEGGIDLGVAGALGDAGDVAIDPASDGEAVRAAITDAVARVLGAGKRPIVLGGDHAITFPVVRAVRAAHPLLSILHVDAHPDLYDEFEGDRWSHATPFARIMEAGLADRLSQIGIRAMTGHQREQAERFGVEVIDMRAWATGRRPTIATPVYISIDCDGLDPAFAPGVSHREPGGLSVRDVLGLVQQLQVPIVGADVVEFNPSQDPVGITAPVCAKIVKEIAGAMIAGR